MKQGSEKVSYGGQAVIEGVMMRGADTMATAVRDPEGIIRTEQRPVTSILKCHPLLRLPIIRGVFALFDSLLLGMWALSYSAGIASGEEEHLSGTAIAGTIIFSLLLGIALFVVAPNLLTGLMVSLKENVFLFNLIEGAMRVTFFLAYVTAIARMKDIRRVFQYHGAEHKVINSLEAGEDISVAGARSYSRLHPRCGTSFIFLVMLVSIIIFSMAGEQDWLWRILSRILLMPLVAGIAYEVIKFAGRRRENRLACWVTAPGMWLQRLTTREPDDSQLEVAVAALQPVLLPVGGETVCPDGEFMAIKE